MYIKKVFIILLVMSQSLWGQYYSVTNIKSSDTLSIRSSTSISSKKVGELPYNATHIKIDHCKSSKNKKGPKKWCLIMYDTLSDKLFKGWVAEKYLKKSTNSIHQEQKYVDKKFKVIRHSPGEVLNVRAGMSSKYKVVGELAYNKTDINILSCENSKKQSKWCWIFYKADHGGDCFGWVFSKYLQEEKSDDSKKIGTYKVTISKLSLRDGHSKENKILGKVKKGTIVYVEEFYGKWAKTSYGWLSGKYLKLVQDMQKGSFHEEECKNMISFLNEELLFKHEKPIELKTILNIAYKVNDDCLEYADMQLDRFGSEGCYLGPDSLVRSAKLQLKGIYNFEVGCEQLKYTNKLQGKTSYDKKNLRVEFEWPNVFYDKSVPSLESVYWSSKDEKERQLTKKEIFNKVKSLSCKNDLIYVLIGPEGRPIYGIICDKVNKYSYTQLRNWCKDGSAEYCYQFAEYLNIEKSYGIYESAVDVAKSALLMKKKKIGMEKIDLAKNYNQVGRFYTNSGDYPHAIKNLKNGLMLRENSFGKDHVETAESYYAIGIYYSAIGDYPKALQYLKKALGIREKTLGKEHIDTIESYHAIAIVHGEIGDYAKALSLLKKSLKIHENILGKETMKITYVYNSIGEVYSLMGQYKKALTYFQKALDIRVKLLNEKHPDSLILYTNISNAYKGEKNYIEAEKYLRKSIAIAGTYKYKASSQVLNDLGLLHMMSKDYRSARNFFKRALLADADFDMKHSDTTYYNMGTVYNFMKKHDKAYEFSKKAFDAFLSNRDKVFQIQSKKQKELYLEGNKNKIKLLLGTAYQYLDVNRTQAKTVEQDVLTRWLDYKGSVFDSENMIATLYDNTQDAALKKQITKLLENKRHLASLYQSLPKPNEKEVWKQNIVDTEEKISTLTNEIASKVTSFKEQQGLKSISFKDISKKLKENELYIDYASVGEKYYVFSLDHKENIVFNEISERDRRKIDMLIKTFREDITIILDESNISDEKLKQLTDTSKEKLSKLYELVLNTPLSNVLKDKTNLILSPDGALRLLPFEAMLNKQNGQYLIEQKEIRYIPSGKELVRLYKYFDTTKTNKENSNVVIFSNPDFNQKINKLASIDKEEMAITPNTSRSGIIKSLFKMRFNPLPGTKEEAQSIKQTLAGKSKLDEYTEASASEANLVKINKPKILHIATHGFFINDNTIPNPMLKSGIALSGANTSAIKGKSDGIVTALKLSGLDLKGTDLVVLSACQTGVVDVNSTESVSGLSKAFIQAGAKDIVMSLWSVNDQATKDLMSSFYKEMQIQTSYSKALKEAKLKMIKKGMHPFFWAPFVVNGL